MCIRGQPSTHSQVSRLDGIIILLSTVSHFRTTHYVRGEPGVWGEARIPGTLKDGRRRAPY